MSLRNSLNVLGGGTPELSGGESATFVNVTSTGQFLAANGTAAAPGYAFTSRPSDGLFSAALGSLGVSTKTLQGPSYLATTTAAGSAFTNQPSNDGVTVVSSSAADVTQVVTIIGTTTATNTVVTENITLTGTTGVPSVKTNWGQILAVKISASCAGTMTVKKTTGLSTIVAITTTNLSAGVNTVAAANVYSYNQTLSTVASGATTKQIGWQGTNSAGTVIYDSNALNGTTAVASNSTFLTVTEIYTGDVEGTRTATVTTNGSFTIQAGNVGLTATGTNQSVTLTPNGTGIISLVGDTTATGYYRTVKAYFGTANYAPDVLASTQSEVFANTTQGACVAGFGTTNDVSLLNRQGVTVIGIVANASTVTLAGTVSSYNGVSTAGWGVPAIQSAGRVTAQSAANASIATYTVGAADGSFVVSANVNVTAATALSTTLTCTYSDESNTSRVMIFPVQQLTGSFIAGGLITATGAWETPAMHIRCKASTSITIKTTAGTFNTVTYTAEGSIRQIA